MLLIYIVRKIIKNSDYLVCKNNIIIDILKLKKFVNKICILENVYIFYIMLSIGKKKIFVVLEGSFNLIWYRINYYKFLYIMI